MDKGEIEMELLLKDLRWWKLVLTQPKHVVVLQTSSAVEVNLGYGSRLDLEREITRKSGQ